MSLLSLLGPAAGRLCLLLVDLRLFSDLQSVPLNDQDIGALSISVVIAHCPGDRTPYGRTTADALAPKPLQASLSGVISAGVNDMYLLYP